MAGKANKDGSSSNPRHNQKLTLSCSRQHVHGDGSCNGTPDQVLNCTKEPHSHSLDAGCYQ